MVQSGAPTLVDTDRIDVLENEYVSCGTVSSRETGVCRTLTAVKRTMVERKLRETGDELKRAREELRISVDQLEHFRSEAEEARIRAMVSETPLAEQEFREASRHAEAMGTHTNELQERIVFLEARQDELLDEMMGS